MVGLLSCNPRSTYKPSMCASVYLEEERDPPVTILDIRRDRVGHRTCIQTGILMNKNRCWDMWFGGQVIPNNLRNYNVHYAAFIDQ